MGLRRKKKKRPARFLYKGSILTVREIAERLGSTPKAVRSYLRYRHSLDGIEEKFNASREEGMNLDTLFLQGKVDEYTYTRYLREFEEQQRHGTGHKAVARIVDGRTYYEMTGKRDYFYGGIYFPEAHLYQPFEDICDAAAERLPIPDYRNKVIREVEESYGTRYVKYVGDLPEVGERWMPSGSMTMPPPDSPFDESLDDYLKRVEEQH